VSLAIAVVGTATAIAASLASVFQANFKKGIAYSTIAQLGYMFAGVGVGAPFTGLFHLFTHASFKALLFLAAGIVIHGAGGREGLADLRGLGRFFTFSRWGFLIGSLALIGTPLVTAGSFSKDAIIDAAMATQPVIGWILLLGVTLTGVYIGRLFGIVYLAAAADPRAVHHDPESEQPMNWSIVPLMVGSVVLGYLGNWLIGVLSGPLGAIEPLPPIFTVSGGVAFILGAIGFVGTSWYVQRPEFATVRGETSYRPDAWVRMIAEAAYAVTDSLRRVQSGLLTRYAFSSLIAIAVILLLGVSLR
jgi:NADH:ubiquinone oxidoreductase subunit 5 (subunit L)/multisubunit Na+/H+ antiporter MnhA subunit